MRITAGLKAILTMLLHLLALYSLTHQDGKGNSGERCQYNTVVVVGHSFGGNAAWELHKSFIRIVVRKSRSICFYTFDPRTPAKNLFSFPTPYEGGVMENALVDRLIVRVIAVNKPAVTFSWEDRHLELRMNKIRPKMMILALSRHLPPISRPNWALVQPLRTDPLTNSYVK